MNRRILAGVVVFTLSLLPLSAVGAATEEVGAGTASTSLSLASLAIEGLPGGLDDVSLGALLSYASTDPDTSLNALGAGERFARATLTLPVVGDVTVTSDGDGFDPGQTVTLPAGLGSVTAGRMSAATTLDSATSVLHALEGELDLAIAGLNVALPETGSFSVVNGTGAQALNGARLENLSLDLTDILPLDILEQLPLSVLLDLADGLIPDLGGALEDIRKQVQELLDELLELADLEGQIEGVLDQLDELPSLGDAIDEVNALTAEITGLEATIPTLEAERDTAAGLLNDANEDLQDALDDLNDAITAIEGSGVDLLGNTAEEACAIGAIAALLGSLCTDLAVAQTAVDTAESLVETRQGAFDIAQEALDATLQDIADFTVDLDAATLIRNLVQTLTDTLSGLLDLVNDLLDDLLDLVDGIDVADLVALLEGLIEGLAGLELFSLGQVVVGVDSQATAAGSSATALCTVDDVTVLGQTHEVSTCEQVQAALAELRGTVLGVLDGLPIAGDLTSGIVRIDGLVATSSADDTRSGSYYTASSAVQGLRVEVDPISLTQTVDDLVATLIGTIDDVLADLLALLGDTEIVDIAFAHEDELDADALIVALIAELTALLDDITHELPLGIDLAGVTTPRLAVNALDIGSESMFTAAGFGTPIDAPVTPAVPTAPTAPATPQLPQTGGGLALALMLLVGGGALAYASRGRRPAEEQ